MSSAGLLLQEVPLAYMEKENNSMIRIRSKIQQTPPYTPPQRVESMAGGSIVHQSSFVTFRAIGKQVFLHVNDIQDNRSTSNTRTNSDTPSLAIQLPESAARNGVNIFESPDKQYLSVCIVTSAKTVHRFCYKLEPTLTFSEAAREEVAYGITSISPQTSISCVCWLDECNVVIGSDNGSVVAINVGLSIFGHSASSFHEVPLTDNSALKWVWEGLGFHGNKSQPIIAIAPVPDIQNDENEATNDTLIVTLSADLVLRVWSYEQQSCLCNQNLRPILSMENEIVQQASIRFVVDKSPAAPRLLLHVTSQASKTKEIFLLRGEIAPRTLDLDVARRFIIDAQPAVRLVDFVIDEAQMYSVWRSATEDFVYVAPVSLTGPKVVPATLIGSMQALDRNHQDEDNNCDAIDANGIDAFFLQRLFAADRFSESCIRLALGTSASHHVPLRREVAEYIHRQLQIQDTRRQKDPTVTRINTWKQFLYVCNKHWTTENIPLGLSACAIAGSPVLIRRNHISIFFPSASVIVSNKVSSHVNELENLVFDFFQHFPRNEIQEIFQNEWNTDIYVDLSATSRLNSLRKALNNGLVKNNSLNQENFGRILPQFLVRLAPLLSGDATSQIHLLEQLVSCISLKEIEKNDTNLILKPFFSTNEMSTAYYRMGSILVHEMFQSTCSVLYFLIYLDTMEPTICKLKTIQYLKKNLLPKIILILEKWIYYKCLFTQLNGSIIIKNYILLNNIDKNNLKNSIIYLLKNIDEMNFILFLKTTNYNGILRLVISYHLKKLKNKNIKLFLFHIFGNSLIIKSNYAKDNNNEKYINIFLKHAIRCYIKTIQLAENKTTSNLIYEITGYIKENIPKTYTKYILLFLKNIIPYTPNDAKEFLWYNLFKIFLIEKKYYDAYMALNHINQINSFLTDENVRHFVLQLIDTGRLDIVCGLTWGGLEPIVERLLLWQAANTHANLNIKRFSQNAVTILELLYSFYVKRSRYAHAACAMYTLYLRLECDTITVDRIRQQCNALLVCSNILLFLKQENRWFICQNNFQQNEKIDVITENDIKKELILLRGKLILPISNLILGQTSASEIVSLLLKHINQENMSKTLKFAVAITKEYQLDMNVVIRALTRDFAFSNGTEIYLKELLLYFDENEFYLVAIDTLLVHHASIPSWLYENTLKNNSFHGQSLLNIYLKHGILEETLDLSNEILLKTTTMSMESFKKNISVSKQTWLSYSLFDDILNATNYAIQIEENNGHDITILKSKILKLNKNLKEYIKYIQIYDKAIDIKQHII